MEGLEAGLVRESRKLEERGRSELSAALGRISSEGDNGWLSKASPSRVSGEDNWWEGK